ncbi:MAG TPA: hypothetical protein VGO34_03730 [Alphaproteobacteria bacterium]|jgi:hypothetical protein
MKMRALAFVLLAVAPALAACGGTPAPDPAKLAAEDHEFDSLRRLARGAFENGQYAQAVGLYDRALARAFARDDLPAIGDLGYESSLALLRDDRPADAARRARDTATELARRGQAPFPALTLAEAVALYGAKDPQAGQTAQRAREAAGTNAALTARADYLIGMIAADSGDAATLTRIVNGLSAPTEPGLKADRQELLGRSQLLANAPAQAVTSFQDTVELRRKTKDLPGVARALAFAGQAAQAAGDGAAAADFYLRAGRAAQSNGRPADARQWLTNAAQLAQANGAATVLAEARQRLGDIGAP